MSQSPLPDGSLKWLAPARVLCTDRSGGFSAGVYASNNLGLHVADVAAQVQRNRAQLHEQPGINAVQWLDQVHGTQVLAAASVQQPPPVADAVWTTTPGLALAILSADCAPVVLVDVEGEVVGAAHAGWRGLCAGVLAKLVQALPVPVSRLQALVGPTIGQAAFEVGADVVARLADYGINPILNPELVAVAGRDDKFHVDLAAACRFDLARLGVAQCRGGRWCTATDPRFYSWRGETRRASAAAEQPATGRQATLVWLP